MARAATKRSSTKEGSGKKGGSGRISRAGSSGKNGNITVSSTKEKQTSKPPGTPSRGTKKSSTTRRGKSAELVKDVEVMAKRVGVELAKEDKKREREVKSAIEETSDRPYREYSKQGALEKLKKTHKVAKKPTGRGDPFADADRRSARSKSGINAPPSENEQKLPPTKRHTKTGDMSERSKVSNEKNRPLADALYELADFVLHGDTLQKGLSYQKAAKSVREAKQPIQSKEAAKKLAGVGKSVGDKIDEFVTKGKIQVLEEYRSGQRGK